MFGKVTFEIHANVVGRSCTVDGAGGGGGTRYHPIQGRRKEFFN